MRNIKESIYMGIDENLRTIAEFRRIAIDMDVMEADEIDKHIEEAGAKFIKEMENMSTPEIMFKQLTRMAKREAEKDARKNND